MRFALMLFGETEEGMETRGAVEDRVASLRRELKSLGYPCDMMWGDEVPVDEPDIDGMVAEMDTLIEELTPEPVVDDVAEFDAPLIDRIKTLQKAAENAHMSRRELADALGVTQYAITKALKNA